MEDIFLYTNINETSNITTVRKDDIILYLGSISNHDALYFFQGIVHRDLLSLKTSARHLVEFPT